MGSLIYIGSCRRESGCATICISFLPFPVLLFAYIIRLWKSSSEHVDRGTISPTIMRSMTLEVCGECGCPGRVIGEIERMLLYVHM